MVKKRERDEAPDESLWGLDSDFKLEKKHLDEAKKLDRLECLMLYNTRNDIQKRRKAMGNQLSALDREVSLRSGETHNALVLGQALSGLEKVEKGLDKALAAYAKAQPLGQWMTSIPGVGPILAAGLMAHVDFHHCCCPQYRRVPHEDIPKEHWASCPGLVNAGHLISFAGQMDPASYIWGKGQKRPYNLALKTLCWCLGESFKKQAPIRRYEGLSVKRLADLLIEEAADKDKTLSQDDALEAAEKRKAFNDAKLDRLDLPEYTYIKRYYNERKRQEEANDRGDNREKALGMLAKAVEGNWGISPEQRKTWSSGKLQAKGLDLRSMRYAVRLFLNHFFQVGREIHFGEAPKPWVIAHGGHTHYEAPPNWPMVAAAKKRAKAETIAV